MTAAAVSLAVIAGLAGPLAYSSSTATSAYTGAIPVAGPAVAGGGFGAFRGAGGAGKGGAGGGRFPGGAGGFPGGAAGARGTGTGSAPAGGQPGAGRFPDSAGGRGFGDGVRGGGGLGRDTQVNSALTKLLKDGAAGYTWVAATVGAESAAPLQLASDDPIMAIGGFNGTDPAPTLAQFEKLGPNTRSTTSRGRTRPASAAGPATRRRLPPGWRSISPARPSQGSPYTT